MTGFPHSRRWYLAASAVAFAASLAACGGSDNTAENTPGGPTTPADGPVRTGGYITLPTGEKMRYSLLLPSGKGSFPLLVEYDGYISGSYPNSSASWVNEGYAVMGLNVPGTGCSTGQTHVFDETVGKAGAFAIEWAGQQSWSNGRIGMIGYSYSGYNQLWTAAHRPKGLLAITPSKNVGDPYRDIGYPGGIANTGFPSQWWGVFPSIWQKANDLAVSLFGDDTCAKTVADNIEYIHRPEVDLNNWLKNAYSDYPLYGQRSAMHVTGKINIPTLGNQSWQDEQIGPRSGYYEDTIAPEKMWLVSSNGDHHTNLTSDYIGSTIKQFLAHFVKGEDNGFEKEPHVRLAQEMQITDKKSITGAPKIEPQAVATFDRLPVKVKPMRLWMQPGNQLGDAMPTASSSSSDYRYPIKSSVVNNPAKEGWYAAASSEKDGQLTFTTAKLPATLSFYGEGSADLWLSSDAPDTDVQVTVSEVRPDGQEMFVQRGWLRVSKRAVDESKSTVLRPWAYFTQAKQAMLTPSQPVLARVEIQKFAHVFRKDSSIRVTIDTPSPTGLWIFDNIQQAAQNTLWHDATRASSIVLGYVPYEHAAGLPSCEKTIRQPCRAIEPGDVVPAGVGPLPPG